jgi:nicotinamide-nucleotide amidase
MIAEVVSVGTELLLGQIIDTNAAFVAQALSSLGIDVYYRTTVGDNPKRMRATIDLALSRADIVITIGGLGPTMDDLTKEISCEAMGVELIVDAAIELSLEDFAVRRGAKLPPSFLKQALVPKSDGWPMPNPNGTAPGNVVEKGGKTIICLPGPPNELIPMVEQSVIPYIAAKSGDKQTVIKSRVLRVIGVGESIAEDTVKDLMQSSNPTVAPYAKLGECHLRITARARDDNEALAMIAPIETEIRDRLGSAIYGVDDETLEQVIVQLLTERGQFLSLAESCTGGLVVQRITSIAGSSAVFRTGIVSYSNDAKGKLLGVKESSLESFGAVSREVAAEMVTGVRDLDQADYAISVTGIAGPSGGTSEKPVGLVYIAVAGPNALRVEQFHFIGRRADIQRRSAHAALALVREMLLQDAEWSNVRSIFSGLYKSV